MGLGFIRVDDDVEVGGSVVANGSGSVLALDVDVAAGGTLGPGVAVAGCMFIMASGSDIELRVETVDGEAEATLDPGAFGVIGPCVDWYIDPTQGLHVQAALGWSRFSLGEPGDAGAQRVTLEYEGIGAALGAGYEWWAGAQWSVGIMARVMAAQLQGSVGIATHDARLIAPALLFTATNH